MDIQIKRDGSSFESLMNRAYPNSKANKNGVEAAKMTRFIETENGIKYKGDPSRLVQLKALKRSLGKVISKFQKLNVNEEQLNDLLAIRNKVDSSGHSSELVYSTQELLEWINEFENI